MNRLNIIKSNKSICYPKTVLSNSLSRFGEKKINNEEFINTNFNNDIPSGVSIESASYMENQAENSLNTPGGSTNFSIESDSKEEYTPKLFSEDIKPEIANDAGDNETHIEKLFDQDSNEEEDFEIPAFLRKQKF